MTVPRTRILVAGFGNVLRGDDGFGVEVLRRLAECGCASDDVVLFDVGTGGIRLAQELLGGYDRLIIIDAMQRNGDPGTLYVLAVDSVQAAGEIDMHVAVPSRALAVAKSLGAVPREVFMVGCEPAEVDELEMRLSPAVRAAVEPAVMRVRELIAAAGESPTSPAGAGVHRA
jgi:hydrogenase maturation protease